MGKGREGPRKVNKCGMMGERGEAVGSHAKHLIKVQGERRADRRKKHAKARG